MRRSPRLVSASPRRPVLALEALEGREVPAGGLTASLSPTGVLTINGDEDGNGVTLLVTAAGATLTPDGTTRVNGGPAGDPAAFAGVVKSVLANFKGGADVVSINGAAPFLVPGAVSITLGDGNNSLDLTTTAKFEVGSLLVKGGDGSDNVTLDGGTAGDSQVKGAATFTYANGGGTTALADIKFALGARVIAGDGVGIPNEVTGSNVWSVGPFSAALGNSRPALVTFTGSTLGALVQTGNVVGALLTNTEVKGAVTVRGLFEAGVTMDESTVGGSVTVAGGVAAFDAANAGSTNNRNQARIGSGWTTTSFQSMTLSEVKGNVVVTGGWFNDQFTTNGLFKAGKAVNLNLKGGDNSVTLGDGSEVVSVGGALTVRGAAGVDTVTLDRVAVVGATLVSTLQGADLLTIDGGATFATTFTADLGTGDDTIAIAQNIGATRPVTFTGNVKILAGLGNDTLSLGLDAGSGGDANSRAVFNGLTDMIDGGLGIDFFDAALGQFTGATPTGWELPPAP